MTRVPRRPVARRTFAKEDDLRQMRAELAEWGWDLVLGTGGYWYATSPDGLQRLTDRNPVRTYHLAMASIAWNQRQEQAMMDHLEQFNTLPKTEEEL